MLSKNKINTVVRRENDNDASRFFLSKNHYSAETTCQHLLAFHNGSLLFWVTISVYKEIHSGKVLPKY